MSSKKEKLGQEPAFPVDEIDFNHDGIVKEERHGMDKRFYAACAAMQGILSNKELRMKILHDEKNGFGNLSKIAFDCADELLNQEKE